MPLRHRQHAVSRGRCGISVAQIGRYGTQTQRGEAAIASANAADMLERLFGRMKQIQDLSKDAIIDR